MRIVDFAQGTPEWLEWRKKGISATSLAVILGKNPLKTPYQLWLELVGLVMPPNLSVIPAVRMGNKLEPLALQDYEDRFGQIGLPICAESDDDPIIRASLDGLTGNGMPVEIKNLSQDNHKKVLAEQGASEFYQLYQWQVKHQLVVTGADKGLLWFWSPRAEPVALTVTLEVGEKEMIIKACQDFWQLVVNRTPPERDPLRDPLLRNDVPVEWALVAEKRRELEKKIIALKDEQKKLDAEAKALNGQLTDMMGDVRNANAYGVRITNSEVSGRIDWESVARSLIPDIDSPAKAALVETHRSASRSQCRVTVNTDYNSATEAVLPSATTRTAAQSTPEPRQFKRSTLGIRF